MPVFWKPWEPKCPAFKRKPGEKPYYMVTNVKSDDPNDMSFLSKLFGDRLKDEDLKKLRDDVDSVLSVPAKKRRRVGRQANANPNEQAVNREVIRGVPEPSPARSLDSGFDSPGNQRHVEVVEAAVAGGRGGGSGQGSRPAAAAGARAASPPVEYVDLTDDDEDCFVRLN